MHTGVKSLVVLFLIDRELSNAIIIHFNSRMSRSTRILTVKNTLGDKIPKYAPFLHPSQKRNRGFIEYDIRFGHTVTK